MRNRRMTVVVAAAMLGLTAALPVTAAPGDKGRDKVAAAIRADHDAAIGRLREWIALPTIANMGVNHARARSTCASSPSTQVSNRPK